jgi:hypothetical protein
MTRALLACCLLSSIIAGCRPYAETYEDCFATADCVSDRERCVTLANGSGRDEICTLSCSTDLDCPIDGRGNGGICSGAGGTGSSVCLQRCSTDFDCYGSLVCAGGACLPRAGGPVTGFVQNYRSCSVSSDCRDSTLECTRFNVGGAIQDICTESRCATDADCPIDARGGQGLCLSFDGGATRACWERCNFRADCENTVEWDCTTNVGGFGVPPPGVCAPR